MSLFTISKDKFFPLWGQNCCIWEHLQSNYMFIQLWQFRIESLKKKIQALTWFKPLTSAIQVWHSSNEANKTTGSRLLNRFVINPWKDGDEVMNCRVNNEMKDGHRSYITNFWSLEKKSLKKNQSCMAPKSINQLHSGIYKSSISLYNQKRK